MLLAVSAQGIFSQQLTALSIALAILAVSLGISFILVSVTLSGEG